MNKASIILASLLFLLFLSACAETGRATQPVVQKETVNLRLVVEAGGHGLLDKEIFAEKGLNAFEVMKANAEVEYTEYEFGPFIEEIEGVRPAEGEFWAFYVNGEMAPMGIISYSIEEDMEIGWKLLSEQEFFG